MHKEDLTGVFKILVDGQVRKYIRYADIPESFDNVISFLPDWPEGPHTEEQHEFLDGLHEVLVLDLLRREKK